MPNSVPDLEQAIAGINATKHELITTSIRIPPEMLARVEDLSEDFERSRNETLLILLKAGLKTAEEEIEKRTTDDEDFLNYHDDRRDITYFILNTNKSNSIDEHKRMLSQKRAEAFGGRKDSIDRIQNNDIVFLYESGQGIIAWGKATGETKQVGSYTKYKDLNDFTLLSHPLPASKVKEIIGRKIPFAQTMLRVPDGKKILEHLNKK